MKQNFYEKMRQFDLNLPIAYRRKKFEAVETELRNMLEIAEDLAQKYLVLGMMVNHYHFIGKLPLAEDAIRKRITLNQEQVDGWLGLAEHFHYHDEDFDRAAQYIEVALQKALATRELVRQVLGVRIRIALAQKNYRIVNDSLLMLADYRPPKGGFDVAIESDFILQIPANSVDEDVLSRYKALVSK